MIRLLLALLLALATLSWAGNRARAQGGQAVDLELALLIDVSSSVNDEEFGLQLGGLAAAFRDPRVHDAIRRVARRGIAVAVIQWANTANQRISLDWTLLRGEADAIHLASRIASMPRLDHRGHTAIGAALAFTLEELESNRFVGLRRVIDLSGDGRNNDGRPMSSIREEILERGVTINALAILNELPLLDGYFRKYLIGGAGSFVTTAEDYADFAEAITRKLVREINAAPLAQNRVPAAEIPPIQTAGPPSRQVLESMGVQ